LYEFTSSGLNVAIRTTGLPNRFRLGEDYLRQENFGLIEIDWARPDPRVSLQVRGVNGSLLKHHDFDLSTIHDPADDLY
jgi:alkaline phosphatase D